MMKTNLLVLLASVLVALGIGEIGARWMVAPARAQLKTVTDLLEKNKSDPYEEAGAYYGQLDSFAMMDFSPYAAYFPAANRVGHGYRTNPQGLRDDRDLRQIKGDLIFVTGGSTAWGAGVSQDRLFTRFAEAQLSKSARRPIAIVSAGVGAYSSSQEVAVVMNKLVRYHPKVVVMFTGWNDTYFGYLGKTPEEGNDYLDFRGRILTAIGNKNCSLETHLCIQQTPKNDACATQSLPFELARLYCGIRESKKIRSRLRPEMEVVNDLIRNVDVIADLGRRENFQLQVLLQPTLYNTRKRLTPFESGLLRQAEQQYIAFPRYNAAIYDLYRRQLHDDAARSGYVFVDADEAILEEPKSVFVDHAHLGDRGNRLVGQLLAKIVAKGV